MTILGRSGGGIGRRVADAGAADGVAAGELAPGRKLAGAGAAAVRCGWGDHWGVLLHTGLHAQLLTKALYCIILVLATSARPGVPVNANVLETQELGYGFNLRLPWQCAWPF